MQWVLNRERAPDPTVQTVSELTGRIKDLLEGALHNVWVEGELSGCRRHSSGHIYFTLKDAGASLSGAMWRSGARGLRMDLEDGMKVLVKGAISVYAPRGNYQLIAEAIEPRGLGELQVAFEQLKARLAAEGLFDARRKRQMPRAPRCIGVVTSPTGAAVRDVLQVLGRRYPLAEVVVAAARVQGPGSAHDVVAALDRLNRWGGMDVILVTRGGGSLEDLWTFNEESVARAIASSAAPVMSAVGHEVDFTIADFVADARAPTPSAAAEMLVPDGEALFAAFRELEGRLIAAQRRRLVQRRVGLMGLSERLVDPRRRLVDRRRRLEELRERLAQAGVAGVRRRRASLEAAQRTLGHLSPAAAIARRRERVRGLQTRLDGAMQRGLEHRGRRMAVAVGQLEALSPLKVLARGYAIATGAAGQVLTRADQVAPGDEVRVRLGEGTLLARVEEVQANEGGRSLSDEG